MATVSTHLMVYTCRVECWDGVVREFVRTGYFFNTDILRHCLAHWNGQLGPTGKPYQYFETPEQVRHNEGTCCVPVNSVPRYSILWWGKQQHECSFVN